MTPITVGNCKEADSVAKLSGLPAKMSLNHSRYLWGHCWLLTIEASWVFWRRDKTGYMADRYLNTTPGVGGALRKWVVALASSWYSLTLSSDNALATSSRARRKCSRWFWGRSTPSVSRKAAAQVSMRFLLLLARRCSQVIARVPVGGAVTRHAGPFWGRLGAWFLKYRSTFCAEELATELGGETDKKYEHRAFPSRWFQISSEIPPWHTGRPNFFANRVFCSD